MAVDYHVLYQSSRPDIRPNGALSKVVDVTFVVDTDPASGHMDTVSIPEDRYNADNVKALIEDRVARIKAVAEL